MSAARGLHESCNRRCIAFCPECPCLPPFSTSPQQSPTACPSTRRRSSTLSSTICSTCRASSRRSPRGRDYYHGAGLRGARPHAAALDQHGGGVHQAGLAHGRVSLGRVPDGPAPRQQPDQPRHLRRSARRRCTELGLDLDELLEQEEEPGPRQRRPRPPRRVLHRLARDAARCPRSATASATSSASSSRRSSTAGRSRRTDKWLRYGNPWEIARPEWARAR